jgi:hypothetical protein
MIGGDGIEPPTPCVGRLIEKAMRLTAPQA